jgi:zinc protease
MWPTSRIERWKGTRVSESGIQYPAFRFCPLLIPNPQPLTPRKLAHGPKLVALLLCAGVLLSQAIAAAREFPPEVPPPKPLVLPSAQIRELPNGLKVVVIERHSLPLLTLRLVVKSGAEADPPDLAGTAQLVAGLLNQGTARRSAREIAEAIDLMGGSVDNAAEWDNSFVSLTVLSDHTELAFDLLADMVRHPVFAPAEIERQRTQTLSALEILRDDPAYMADAVFNVLIYSGTPYGHPLDGTEESVRRLTQRDLQVFHTQHYRPSNCILAAVGDITPSQATALVEKFFGEWEKEKSQAPQRLPGVVTVTSSRRIVVIDKSDAVQTEIRVGNLAIRRNSPDYYALTAANQILGGPAANRLFKALRSQQGLTYGASSELVCQQGLGTWVAKTSTRTAETARSMRQVLDQMQRLRDHPVTDDELRTAQSYLVGHLALEFESSDNIASRVLELMVHNLPLDYWNRFPQNIQALKAEDLLTATRRYLDPERDVIVLVGSAAGFRREVNQLGTWEVVPLRDLDLASPTLMRAAGATPH